MRYKRKEIGCEVKYSERDLRALEYIKEFKLELENEEDILDEHDEESNKLIGINN